MLSYRNSLGSVSERTEQESGRGDGGYVAGHAAKEGGGGGAPEDGEGSEEADASAVERTGAEEMRALWDPAAFGDDGIG